MVRWLQAKEGLHRHIGLMLLLCVALLMLTPGTGFAAADTGGGLNPGGTVEPWNQYGLSPTCEAINVKDGSLSSKVVKCIKLTVQQGEKVYREAFMDLMKPAIYAAMTLAVALFGVQVILGIVDRISARGFLLVFKIALIIWTFDEFDFITTSAMNAGEELQTIATGAFNDPSITLFKCPTMVNGQPINAWDRYDCILGGMFGFVKETANNAKTGKPNILTFGILPIISVALFSGTIGASLFMAGITALLTIVLSLFKATYIYLMSITVLAFLFIMAPLMVPCILFQETARFFEKWVQTIMSFLLQPIILAAFLSMYLSTMDTLIYMGGQDATAAKNTLQGWFNSLDPKYKVSGALEPGADYGQLIIPRTPLINIPFATDPQFAIDIVGKPAYVAASAFAKTVGWTNPVADGVNNFNNLVSFPTLNMDGEMKKRLWDLALELIAIAYCGHVMTKLLSAIPEIAHQMVSAAWVSNLMQGKMMPFEGNIMGAVGGMGNAIQGLSSAGGEDGGGGGGGGNNPLSFITDRIPQGVKQAAQGFISPAKQLASFVRRG